MSSISTQFVFVDLSCKNNKINNTITISYDIYKKFVMPFFFLIGSLFIVNALYFISGRYLFNFKICFSVAFPFSKKTLFLHPLVMHADDFVFLLVYENQETGFLSVDNYSYFNSCRPILVLCDKKRYAMQT